VVGTGIALVAPFTPAAARSAVPRWDGSTAPASMSTATNEDGRGFCDLGPECGAARALSQLGYEQPTPIQREAIPPLLEGRDLIGQAATGPARRRRFALPLLQRDAAHRAEAEPIALVLVPTRELAMQVSQALYRYGRALGPRVQPIYGGQPIGRQLAALARGVDVVVATPGRALDHVSRGRFGCTR
jgi:ATP-dependent RNA helicase DeaD